jgi:hypothetical protein
MIQQQKVRPPKICKGRKEEGVRKLDAESLVVKEREEGRWLTFFVEVAKKVWYVALCARLGFVWQAAMPL